MSYTIVLTWTDKEQKHHRKEYTNERDAIKARKWLADNGADDTDLAIVVKPKNDIVEP